MPFVSVSWEYRPDRVDPCIEPIRIDACKQRDKSVLYAIRQHGACMNHKGEWEFEPLPSSRDEEWMKEFRYETWDEAARLIDKLYRNIPNGRIEN